MKIIEISRTVSDTCYNNQSARAVLGEDEDPIKAAIELDSKVKEMMAAIDDKVSSVEDFRKEKSAAINILEDALKYAQSQEIPF